MFLDELDKKIAWEELVQTWNLDFVEVVIMPCWIADKRFSMARYVFCNSEVRSEMTECSFFLYSNIFMISSAISSKLFSC